MPSIVWRLRKFKTSALYPRLRRNFPHGFWMLLCACFSLVAIGVGSAHLGYLPFLLFLPPMWIGTTAAFFGVLILWLANLWS